MKPEELPDYLPISQLNAFLYCPRRFWIEFVQAEMEENAFILEGLQEHERIDDPGRSHIEGGVAYRHVYLYSERLRIAGFADVVEESNGILKPVEYKHGRMNRWLNDHVQLCAQALCLEERLGVEVPAGAIFYHGNRRREHVPFTVELREATERTIEQVWEALRKGILPAPITQAAKCRDCSIREICLPEEVLLLRNGAMRVHRGTGRG